LIDALYFILPRAGALNTVLQLSEQPLVSDEYIIVYRVLIPLVLFSRATESRDRRLCDVIPATREILRESSVIWDSSRHSLKQRYLIEVFLAHFWARLEMKALKTIITTYAHSPRRKTIPDKR
jgi:hypothetical protein